MTSHMHALMVLLTVLMFDVVMWYSDYCDLRGSILEIFARL
jgi:hypothetical protein